MDAAYSFQRMQWFGFIGSKNCRGNTIGDCCTSCGAQLKDVRSCRWNDYMHLCVRCYEAVAALEALRQ